MQALKHLPFDTVGQKKLEPLTMLPYHQLIDKKAQVGMPYILGFINDRFNSEMDGVRLYKANGNNPYSGEKVNEVFYYTIKKNQDQLTYLGRGNEQDSEMKEFLQRFFDANEGSIEAQRKLGDFYIEKGNDPEALCYYKLVAKRGLRQDVQKFGDLAMKIAISSYQNKDNAKAVEYYKMALESGALFPEETVSSIYTLLGNLYCIGQEDLSEAIKYYKLACSPQSHVNLGDIYLKRGNSIDALHYYELAAKAGFNGGIQKFGDLALRMGDFCLINNHIPNTIKYYKMALASGSVIPSDRLGIVNYKLGRLYESGIGVQQSNSEAKKYYTHALWEDHPITMINFAFTYASSKRIKVANFLVRRFVQLGFGEKDDMSHLYPWIQSMRQFAPQDQKFQIALDDLEGQCCPKEVDKKILADISNLTRNQAFQKKTTATGIQIALI